MIRIKSDPSGPYITLADLCNFLHPYIPSSVSMSEFNLRVLIETNLDYLDIDYLNNKFNVSHVMEALKYSLRDIECYECNGHGDVKNDEIFCDRCDGTGKEEDMCNECEGDGEVERESPRGRSRYVRCENCEGNGDVQLTCNMCDGKGYYKVHIPCERCNGNGGIDMRYICTNMEKGMKDINLNPNMLVKV